MIDGRRGRKTDDGGAPPPARSRRSIGQHLVALGVSADAITALGVVLAAVTAALIGFHWFIPAVALIIIGGLMDTLDGHVAKVAGTASSRGAYFDSVADRVADAAIFGGLAWYFIRAHDPTAALVPIGILAVASIVSYQRAKAESLGFSAQGGMMERAERLIFLGATLFIAFFAPVVLVPLLLALLALTTATCIGRFSRVWVQATATKPAAGGMGRAVPRRWHTDRSRRDRRDLVPLSTRLRVVFGASGAGTPSRRERAGRRRSARAFGHRIDSER